MRILSNSAKFSAGRPLLPAYNFSVTMACSTYRLRTVVSLKFLAIENKSPHYWADVYYDQTAGWIRIPLGMGLRLGPGDVVLDRDPTPPPSKGAAAAASTFGPLL